MLFEIHMLKNYPPTNLNRDDTGAPKTCMFGGVTRGRISSQCLKRSWRTSELFKNAVGENNLGIRTRKLPELIAEKLLQSGVSEDYVQVVKPKISGFGKKDGKETKEGNTKQVLFLAPQDIDAVAKIVKQKIDACKSIEEVKELNLNERQIYTDAEVRPVTLDIALFGRMVTSDAFRPVEASMQVAHAISTNKISVESDYFTAMDDLICGDNMDEMGAGMIGDIDYNASCYYVYASLDTDALKESLKDIENADHIVKLALPALLRAIAFTNPSGKQNSFAGHVLPSCFMIECKEQKVPTSFVNAFAKPISGQNIVEDSIKALVNEADMTSRDFGLPVKERLWFCVDKYDIKPEIEARRFDSFSELIDAATAQLN